MREIEFRAWHKKYEYMERVADISFNRGIVNLNGADISKIEDVELMQYTGLKDKKGVKIFEGDIVKTLGYHHLTPHKIEKTNYVVVWDFARWVLQRKLKTGGVEETLLGDKDDEVIGNIYENPELLEVE